MGSGVGGRTRKYVVRLEGSNFWIEEDGETLPRGFFATRFVEAVGLDSAAEAGLALVRAEFLEWARNAGGDPPDVSVTEVVELDSFGDYAVPGAGATWFDEEHPRDTGRRLL